VIHHLLSKQYQVKTGITVLGEALKVCAEKDKHGCVQNLMAHLSRGEKLIIHEPDGEELARLSKTIESVAKRDWRIGTMDRRILAETLADDTSHGLLTFDNAFMSDAGLSSLRQEAVWRKGFMVTDYVWV
jgi:hypothetical protein